jgi:hypothetical protein
MEDEDKNIIQTEEQYQKLRHYVLDYISRLLKKRHIVKKVKLLRCTGHKEIWLL